MTAQEAADRLDVCPETVRRWARQKRVPAKKNMSRQWLFAVEDLDKLPVHGVVESNGG